MFCVFSTVVANESIWPASFCACVLMSVRPPLMSLAAFCICGASGIWNPPNVVPAAVIGPDPPLIDAPKVRQAAAVARICAGSPSGHKSPTNASTRLHPSGSAISPPNTDGALGVGYFGGSVGLVTGDSPPPTVECALAVP
ncbi:Uncharacterised protein [Mycobacteroides abscessus subsp. abscessus]|nr:Uncharacterised protein [Mycobacteroides abscessus subsp. abscessus]